MGVSGAVGASSSTATMIVDSDEEQGGAAGKIAAKMPLDNMDTQLYVPDTQIVMASLAADELLLSRRRPSLPADAQQTPLQALSLRVLALWIPLPRRLQHRTACT